MKQLMTGDEAVARGAYEAGVRHASAYPGTPSTEILENLSGYDEIETEWGPNEKVAMESAIGAAIAGARSMVSMKHVGLNVAADPLFTWSYMGVNAGNVIVTADEPGMYSSQNEQDNRNYAKAAKLAMLEPSDSQECLDMVKAAYTLSESYDTPVLLRMTTRVCHSKSIVELGEREQVPLKEWVKNPAKYVCLPAIARKLRVNLEDRMEKLAEYSEKSPFNRAEYTDSKVGVIASGICYFYGKEVFGEDASYLKLGFTHPLPQKLIQDFCSRMETVYILEENDPYIQEFVERSGVSCKVVGKDTFPAYGEMTPDVIRKSIGGQERKTIDFDKNGAGLKIFETWKNLLDSGYAANYGSTTADTQTAFFAGQAAIIVESTAILRNAVNSSAFEVGTGYFPKIEDSADGGVIIGGASLWMMDNKDDAKKDAAWKFIEFTTTPEVQATWSMSTGYFAINPAAYETEEMKAFIAENPNFMTAINQLNDTPVNGYTAGVLSGVATESRILFNEAMEKTYNGEFTPQQAVDFLAESVNAAITNYNASTQ